MDRTIDYSPLFTMPSPEEVARFRRAALAARPAATSEQVIQIFAVVIGAMLFLTIGGFMLIAAALTVVDLANGTGDPTALIGVLVSASAPVIAVALALCALSRRRAEWVQRYRMEGFGRANGLQYHAVSPGPAYPGAIFALGSSRRVTDHFRTANPRYLDFGNYQYTTGSGRSRTTRRWGFLALHLDRSLPHMVLDSRANNGMLGTNLPAVFSRSQVLSLEGDFNRYFTLYCPAEYERDALYVFTPDLMALLIDEAAPYDVEIIDRWMLVYSARPFPLADPATYQRLLRIVTTVGAKTLSQTDRYLDERIGVFDANIVAPQGQRLRRGFSWVGVVVIGVFLVIWAGGILSSVLR